MRCSCSRMRWTSRKAERVYAQMSAQLRLALHVGCTTTPSPIQRPPPRQSLVPGVDCCLFVMFCDVHLESAVQTIPVCCAAPLTSEFNAISLENSVSRQRLHMCARGVSVKVCGLLIESIFFQRLIA